MAPNDLAPVAGTHAAPNADDAGLTGRDSYARSLLEASLDPLVTISPQGKITDVNKATEEATGRSRAELIGSDFADYFTEPDKAQAGYQEVFEKGSVTDYALALRHRSGAVMDVLYNATVYRDVRGAVAGVFAAARNVTARRRAEESRARAVRALRMLNAVNNLVIRAANEDRLLADACRAIVEIGGYKLAWVGYAEQDDAKSVRPVAHAGQNGDYVASVDLSWSASDERGRGSTGTAIRTGETVIARDTEADPHFEPWRKRAAEKGYRSAATVPLTQDGKTYGALMVYAGEADAFDAEEIKLLGEVANDLAFATAALRTKAAHDAAEQELRRASIYARSLLEASLDPLVTISPEGRITDVNEATATITGLPRKTLIGSDFSSYFTEPETAREGYRKVFAEGSVSDYPLSIRQAGGKIIEVLYNASIYRDEGGAVAGVFAAARDITALKRAEEELHRSHLELEKRIAERTADLLSVNTRLEAANKELEAFSYSVSHDLRTPLRAIDGFSRILLEDYADKLDEEGKRVLNVVRDSTVKMSRLIDDILAFSRVGRLAMKPVAVDMEALVRETLADPLAAAIGGRKIALEIGRLPPARGDRAMLQRVWVNLLANAIKFTGPNPEARIEIGATAEGGEIVYRVTDNGVGFDMQYADKLFGVFQRLHGGEFPGTGIGLAIVKRIVARHGGRVWAEGKVGEGASFYFALPSEETSHA